MRRLRRLDSGKLLVSATALLACASVATVALAAPQYSIVDMGVVHAGDPASQGFRVSPSGAFATGRNYSFPFSQSASSGQAISWTKAGGLVGLPIYQTTNPVRNYDYGNGVNNAGVIVGGGATTASGANPLPLIWQNGVPSQIPLPAGQTFGNANDINASNVVVGSVNGGSNQIAFVSAGGNSNVVSTLTAGGAYCVTLFSINDSGIAVGAGVDPANPARNVPFVYDTVHNTATEVPPLPGRDGGTAFDISEGGQIAGVSTLGQGSGTAFYWSPSTGSVPIPLVAGTSTNSARGVNSSGWVVGNAGGSFSVPWLWDGTQSYRLQDLIPGNSGWDLSQNTSNAALGISDNGVIVGTGMIGPDTHAFAMIPVPEPTSLAAIAAAGLLAMRRRARRGARTAALVGAGAVSIAAGAAPLTFETVTKSGDTVPGVAGATWNTTSNAYFAAPVVDNSGNVAFRGQMTAGAGGVQSTAPNNQAGYWYGAPGSLNLFARDGSAGPTLSNSYGWIHNTTAGAAGLAAATPIIAPNGTMLVSSTMNGAGAGNGTNTFAWTGASNNLQVLGQQGITAPSGTTHALWSSSLATLPLLGATVNNAGQTIVASNLAADSSGLSDVVSGSSTTSNDSGLWLASPAGNTLIARENAATSIGGGTQFGELGTVGGSSALNGAGQVAVVTTLRAGVGGVVSTAPRNDSVLWTNSAPGGQLTAVARKNDPVPGLAGMNYYNGNAIAFFLGAQPLNNSGRLVFDAQFGTGAAPGTGNEAIMTSSNGNTNVVVRENTPAAGVPGATWNSFNGTNAKMRLNNNNAMLFTGSMSGTANGSADDEGIWLTHIDGSGNATNTQLIAREGQAIPNTGGLQLGGGLVAASAPILNNLDQVVFLGNITGSGITTSNDQGLFEWDSGNGLQLLLREGDDAATSINGLSGTIGNNTATITPFSYAAGGNGEGGSLGLSDTGWLTLALTLRGGSAANDINIIRTQVPEPASIALLGTAGLATLGRRRRTRD